MSEKLLSPSNGLSNLSLSKANASTSDVVMGKSFYSGDKTLKYGTLNLSGATATESDVIEGKSFYSGSSNIRYGNIMNRSYPSGLVDGATRVTVAEHVGEGWYNAGNENVPVIVARPGKGYYDGSGNANIAIDGRLLPQSVLIAFNDSSLSPYCDIAKYYAFKMSYQRHYSNGGDWSDGIAYLSWNGAAYVWQWTIKTAIDCFVSSNGGGWNHYSAGQTVATLNNNQTGVYYVFSTSASF